MSLSIIRNASLGLLSVPIIQSASNLQQFEKGRIHYVDEIIYRIRLITLIKDFYNITLHKNKQSPLSAKVNLATMSIPCVLALLKSSYVSNCISPQIVSMVVRLEKHIGRLCYMVSVINAIALISFGHLIVGYTALTIFALDRITSSILIQTHIPSLNKTRIIFVKYISPFTELTTGIVIKSYLTIGVTAFGLYNLLSEEYHKITTENIKKTSTSIKKTSTSPIKSLEDFKKLWTDLHQQQPELWFEMHRERVCQIQIPPIDPSKYPQSKISEIFDTINWREDFEKSLWDRVKGIVEFDPKKVFKDLENASEEEKKIHRQEELPRAKKMAKEWLDAVLNETTTQDLVLFKQHICKMLLEHRDLLEGNQTKQSHDLFKGLLTLIFGSGAECNVAQGMKVKEAYLEIYKAISNETHQSLFLLMLELLYKNITEQAFKDVLNPVLQKIFELVIQKEKEHLLKYQESFRREWEQRSLFRIHRLACSAFFYSLTKKNLILYKQTKEAFDVNSVHNFTRIAKFFGKPFNIHSDIDEVAERNFSSIAMNPINNSFFKGLNLCMHSSLGKFYWDTQLEKIIEPWLLTHFQKETYFQLNDLTQWFDHLFEGFRTDSNTKEIDTMQGDLQKVIPEIQGFPLVKHDSKSILGPTPKALLAFAYGINLLKKKEPNTPSFFNHIDQELRVTENFEKTTRSASQWFPFFKGIQDTRDQTIRISAELLRDLASDIDKKALFFAQ